MKYFLRFALANASLFVIVAFFAQCERKSGQVGVSSLNLTQDELRNLETQVENEDGRAAHRISLYYTYYMNDPKTGMRWLGKAAKLGDVQTIRELEICEDELKDLVVAVESGNGLAAYRISLYYTYYMNDPKTGMRWLEKAAKLDDDQEEGKVSAPKEMGSGKISTH